MYGILIVDDNSLVRMSLVNLINWKRHNATLVAWRMMETKRFDCAKSIFRILSSPT